MIHYKKILFLSSFIAALAIPQTWARPATQSEYQELPVGSYSCSDGEMRILYNRLAEGKTSKDRLIAIPMQTVTFEKNITTRVDTTCFLSLMKPWMKVDSSGKVILREISVISKSIENGLNSAKNVESEPKPFHPSEGGWIDFLPHGGFDVHFELAEIPSNYNPKTKLPDQAVTFRPSLLHHCVYMGSDE